MTLTTEEKRRQRLYDATKPDQLEDFKRNARDDRYQAYNRWFATTCESLHDIHQKIVCCPVEALDELETILKLKPLT